jgi:hypothetical protein
MRRCVRIRVGEGAGGRREGAPPRSTMDTHPPRQAQSRSMPLRPIAPLADRWNRRLAHADWPWPRYRLVLGRRALRPSYPSIQQLLRTPGPRHPQVSLSGSWSPWMCLARRPCESPASGVALGCCGTTGFKLLDTPSVRPHVPSHALAQPIDKSSRRVWKTRLLSLLLCLYIHKIHSCNES